MSPAPARPVATTNKYGQVGLVPAANSPNTAAVTGSAGTGSPTPASGLNITNLAGTILTGVDDAMTAQQAVAAQSGMLAKFETALTAVFDFVPPLVAVADPAAAGLVEGIGNGVSLILQAVRTHAATTTATPPASGPSGAAPAAPAPAPAIGPVSLASPASASGTSGEGAISSGPETSAATG